MKKLLSRNYIARYLGKLASENHLPFRCDEAGRQLKFTGPEGDIENALLDLYELVVSEKPDIAKQLPPLEEVCSEYANYLGAVDKYREDLISKGELKTDSLTLTEKGFDSLETIVDVGAISGVGFYIPVKDRSKKRFLEKIGISTKKPSKLKAILGAGIVLGAAVFGVAIAKDMHHADKTEYKRADNKNIQASSSTTLYYDADDPAHDVYPPTYTPFNPDEPEIDILHLHGENKPATALFEITMRGNVPTFASETSSWTYTMKYGGAHAQYDCAFTMTAKQILYPGEASCDMYPNIIVRGNTISIEFEKSRLDTGSGESFNIKNMATDYATGEAGVDDFSGVCTWRQPPLTDEQLARLFAPTFYFDSRERWLPVDPYGDGDTNISNNKENYGKGKFPSKPVIFYDVKHYPANIEHPEGFVAIQYWKHHVWNSWFGGDNHGLDWENIDRWADLSDLKGFYSAASCHLWFNKYAENVSAWYQENGSHGCAKETFNIIPYSIIPFDFKNTGKTLRPADYDLKNISALRKFTETDFPGERGKFPTERSYFKDPDRHILQGTLASLTNNLLFVQVRHSPRLSIGLEGKLFTASTIDEKAICSPKAIAVGCSDSAGNLASSRIIFNSSKNETFSADINIINCRSKETTYDAPLRVLSLASVPIIKDKQITIEVPSNLTQGKKIPVDFNGDGKPDYTAGLGATIGSGEPGIVKKYTKTQKAIIAGIGTVFTLGLAYIGHRIYSAFAGRPMEEARSKIRQVKKCRKPASKN